MQAFRKPIFGGYVKVEVRSRSPKLWGWSLYREGNDVPVERSMDLFRHAEDAWKVGQEALSLLEPMLRSEMARLRLEPSPLAAAE